MTNLFSSFSPLSWAHAPLNWASAFSAILLIPATFWLAMNQYYALMKSILAGVAREFNSILNPHSTPGFLLITLSLFVFIALNNSLGLLPYVFTASSHLTFTCTMALPLWVGYMVLAWIQTPKPTLAHLVPLSTPLPLIPFMVCIEIISSSIRPLTLSVRLAANMVAGHLLLSLLAGQAFSLNLSLLVGLMLALILLLILEVAVSLIQAYVFSVLSTLYLNEANNVNISI